MSVQKGSYDGLVKQCLKTLYLIIGTITNNRNDFVEIDYEALFNAVDLDEPYDVAPVRRIVMPEI